LTGEIECYSLPYGGLGFASHIMTYWAITCLSLGRRPLWPASRLKYDRWDNWLAILGLVGGTALASFTAIRCRNTWELLVIGIWAMSTTITNGLVGIHASWIVKRAASKNNAPPWRIWSDPSLHHMTPPYNQYPDYKAVDELLKAKANTRSVWWWVLVCKRPSTSRSNKLSNSNNNRFLRHDTGVLWTGFVSNDKLDIT
jgi:hypothetical protein